MIKISGTYSLMVLSKCLLMVFEVGCVGTKTNNVTRKPTIDELPLRHQLLRSIMKHDGCRLYYPWSNYSNPSFELNNATCHHGCKIVGDLYEEHHQNRPRLVRYGSCKAGLKLIYLQCKCLLTHHYVRAFRWRTLQYTARNYLQDIVDFSISDTWRTTPSTPEPTVGEADEKAFFDSFTNGPREWMKERARRASTTEGESTTTGENVDYSVTSTMPDETVSPTDQLVMTRMTPTIRQEKQEPNKPEPKTIYF
ncbi:unnamed protein product [Bemisia tabaci]|uniref:Uncharacterized protein n=1 Tax=Bemisia tabaci TaxID=7038 RepID=A0A9P0F8W4_BEMTA|nr:unnamed protein product [Bemisia tabaci]